MKVVYTSKAQSDLRAIIDFGIDNDLPDPVGYTQNLQQRLACFATIKNPGRKGRVTDTREWVVSGTSYVAVFATEGGKVIILRVLHGAQRWP